MYTYVLIFFHNWNIFSVFSALYLYALLLFLLLLFIVI